MFHNCMFSIIVMRNSNIILHSLKIKLKKRLLRKNRRSSRRSNTHLFTSIIIKISLIKNVVIEKNAFFQKVNFLVKTT